jgi:hypothetical protein
MQKLMLIVFFAATALLASCNKKSAQEEGAGSLIGKWKLKESRVSPGTPVTVFTPATTDSYVEFKADGTVIWTGDNVMPGHITTYEIVNDSVLNTPQYNSGSPLPYRYKATTTTLTLNPPCFEECTYRYTRVSKH